MNIPLHSPQASTTTTPPQVPSQSTTAIQFHHNQNLLLDMYKTVIFLASELKLQAEVSIHPGSGHADMGSQFIS